MEVNKQEEEKEFVVFTRTLTGHTHKQSQHVYIHTQAITHSRKHITYCTLTHTHTNTYINAHAKGLCFLHFEIKLVDFDQEEISVSFYLFLSFG